MAAGSTVPSHGAASAIENMSASIAAPATTPGLRSKRRPTWVCGAGGAARSISPRSAAMLMTGKLAPHQLTVARSLLALSSIADSWIEQRVGDVDQKIDQHVRQRKEQDHRLYGRIVAREHGVDREASEPGNTEHAFGHDHAADQERDAEPEYRHDGNRGVAQGVPHQHHPIGETFGARGPYVILAEHFEHAGAGDAGDECDVDHGQRETGKDQALHESAEALRERLVALHRQPVDTDREHGDKCIADGEYR